MESSIAQILRNSRSIAIVGASDKRNRDSNKIFRYLVGEGYQVFPVNPKLDEIDGIKCYSSIREIPVDIEVDIVNIFRRPQFVSDIVQESVDRAKNLEHPQPVIWTQLGVSSIQGEEIAESQDLQYIKNRCILVEHSLLA